MDTDYEVQADYAARHWCSPVDVLPIGSPAHKAAFCRMFHDTFNPYKPSVIDWPTLEPPARDRLVSLPIWDIAVQTEGKAKLRMLSYAYAVGDPELSAAIELNGWEEGRHREVLSNLVEAYGIQLAPEPRYKTPRNPEWAYLVTGYSECIDSFFAFGLFELAKRSGFFPSALVDTFEPVIQEETRHIILFANWVAWHRRNIPVVQRIWFELKVAAVWVFLGLERINIARGIDAAPAARPQDNNFTVNGSKAVSGVDVGVGELIDICLAENDRRMAGYDPQLRRPTTAPSLARFARRFLVRSRSPGGQIAPAG